MEGPIVVDLCGMPGVGKTVLARQVAERARHSFPDYNIQLVLELGEDEDTGNLPGLEDYYRNRRHYGACFQVSCITNRWHEWLQVLESASPNTIIISDRSMNEDLNFASMLHDEHTISAEDFKIIQSLHQHVLKTLFQRKIMVLLSADPAVCLQRIKDRNRDCEQSIAVDYLEKLSLQYEKFKDTVDMELDWNTFNSSGEERIVDLISQSLY